MAFRKSFVLLSCTFLGLVCGTLYLFSLYLPQLALRLGYSATDSSKLALCGTVGVALAGPPAGKLVDYKGFSVATMIGGLLIAVSYGCLRQQYVQAHLLVFLLMFYMFMIGLGSTFINLATLKCCAVCFPKIRGVATLLPLALYGLSAMVFSQLALVVCPGDTAKFLAFLAWLVVGIVVVCLPSLVMVDYLGVEAVVGIAISEKPNLEREKEVGAATTSAYSELEEPLLLASPRFWTLFMVLGFGAALGQMYIYSVGYMVKALLSLGTSERVAARTQQGQVLILLVANCLGRILAGVSGDFVVAKKTPRAVLLLVPSIGFVLGLVLGMTVMLPQLWVCLGIHGFSYGFLFCVMPLIVADTFGLAKFSYNWGLVNLAPILPLYVLTLWFGKVYDGNSEVVVLTLLDGGNLALVTTKTTQCLLGQRCYTQVFGVTVWVAVIVLLVVMGGVRKGRAKERERGIEVS